ncbi:MAG: sugar phosphate isomerase/epimerase [Clostridia bacterium]|nr:sugar phosphate isomerase/epimerase [Clostridia bacterium]
MKKEQIYISTIAPDAQKSALEHGFGLEIAEYCTAWNMDVKFERTHASVLRKLEGVSRRVLHASFNELFPCAIDLKARELAAFRYRQAIELARRYGAHKIVIHSGYYEKMYYPVWFVRESIKFWREFMADVPEGITICIENVFEQTSDMLRDIVKGVDRPNFRICLDIGHVNAYSKEPTDSWLDTCADFISHFHIHNNDGSADTHNVLDGGSINMSEFLRSSLQKCPHATYTVEVRDSASCCLWLSEYMSQN